MLTQFKSMTLAFVSCSIKVMQADPYQTGVRYACRPYINNFESRLSEI